MININMRCIEIVHNLFIKCLQIRININMRCIEIVLLKFHSYYVHD